TQIAESEQPKASTTLINEAKTDLNTSIDKSISHVQRLKTMKKELSMSAGGSMGGASTSGSPSAGASGSGASGASGSGASTGAAGSSATSGSGSSTATGGSSDALAKVDDMERQLKDAKAAANKLGVTKKEDLASAIDGVSTHL